MDLTNILNTKDGASVVAAPPHLGLAIEFQKQAYLSNSREHPQSPAPSEFVSDREGSPHSSTSPSASEHSSSYPIQPTPVSVNGPYSATPLVPLNTGGRGPGRPSSGDPFSKAFPCSVCNKGFARRSDLARHGRFLVLSRLIKRRDFADSVVERIHTGIRPHVCDYPGCEKQFIQRSALTVHARVHTGEKPHMCDTCGKV